MLDRRPLQGLRVLVTRSRHQAAALVDLLRDSGAETVEIALIEIAPLDDSAALDHALGHLRHYDWVIFTSVNAVEVVFSRLTALMLDRSVLRSVKVGAIGKATGDALASRGINAAFIPGESVAEAVVAEIGHVDGARILLPKAAQSRPVLPDGLRRKGALVDEIAIYQTLPCSKAAAELNAALERGIDVITLLSSSTVRAFVAAIRDQRRLQRSVIACIGPVTAATAAELGLPVEIVATEATAQGLVRAIAQHSGASA